MRFRGVIMYERVAMGWNGQVGRGTRERGGRKGGQGAGKGVVRFKRSYVISFGRNRILFRLIQRVATARPDKRGRHVGRGRADGSSRDDGWRCVLADWGLR